MLSSCAVYASEGYTGFMSTGEPSHMGTQPSENCAAGFSAAAASSMDHGTSNGVSEHISSEPSNVGRTLELWNSGLTGTAASYVAPDASRVHTRMVLVTNCGMP